MEQVIRKRTYANVCITTKEVVVPDMRQALAMTRGDDETGVLVWPSTHFLCEHIEARIEEFRGKNVIELGAGAGIPGLVAASVAARTVITDGNERTVKCIEENISLNRAVVGDRILETSVFRWGLDVPSHIGASSFDIILGADLMYKGDAFVPLFQACSALAKRHSDSKVLVAYVYENQIELLQRAAEEAGFEATSTTTIPIDISRIDEWQVLDYGEDVILQEFRWNASKLNS